VGPWSASFSSSPSKDPTWLGSKGWKTTWLIHHPSTDMTNQITPEEVSILNVEFTIE
jgi:hypothetical protein